MDEGPRHAVVSADDHGPLLAMSIWFLGCTLILCIVMRLGVRVTSRRLPTAEDFLVLAAAVLAIGGTIAGSFAVKSGLGKKVPLLTPCALQDIQKEMYITTILYVTAIGLSKLSIITFIERLACTSVHTTFVMTLYAVIISWTLAITSGVLFGCEMPRPWTVFEGKCIPLLPFWVIACLIDILTDLGMILLPIQIISSLQLPSRKKAVVISTFALRVFLVALSMIRIILLDRAIYRDKSFDGIPYAIVTQAHSTISVLVACLPGLKPFMDSARMGMLSASLTKRGVGTTFGQDSSGARPRDVSHSTLWDSASQGRRSLPTVCPAEASIFVSDAQGCIVAKPKPMALPKTMYIPGPTRQLSNGLRKGPPPRPPPPPEELRPDLSCFRPRLLRSNSTVVRCERRSSQEAGEITMGYYYAEQAVGG